MLNPKIAKAKNIPESLTLAAELFGDMSALRYKTNSEDKYSGSYTYKQLAEIPRTIGTVLIEEFDLQPEQRVGFISENRFEYNLGDFGTLNAGGISWGLYDFDVKTPEVVEYKLNDSGTEILFTSPTFLDNVRSVYDSGKTPLKKIVVMDMINGDIKYRKNETPFSDFLKNGIENDELINSRLNNVTRDKVSKLIYTSGTTGKPKGVMLTHENLLSNVESCSGLLNVTPGERLIAYLPEAHSFQGFVTLCALLNGCGVWYSHKSSILNDIQLIEPTMFPGVPVVYKRFAEGMRDKVLELTKGFIDLAADYSRNPLKALIRKHLLGPIVLKKGGLGKIVRAVSGSAKLDRTHAKILENIGFIVLEGYGISETSPVISTEVMGVARKSGSVGIPIPNVEVKILSLKEDADGKRKEMEIGKEGELAVKGPNVFKGYFNDEAKTKKAFYDGYYLTGDRGNFDKEGFLYIHGRTGLQVKLANGEFVDLDELGANILRHTSLVQAAIVDCELKEFAIAVVSLQWEPEALEEVGKKLGVPFSGDAVKFAGDEKVIAAIKKELEENQEKFGHPRSPATSKKYLIVAPMSPETGEITSTMKFRVRTVLKKYEKQIEELRNSDEKFKIHIEKQI